jgi:hypothetical protein
MIYFRLSRNTHRGKGEREEGGREREGRMIK